MKRELPHSLSTEVSDDVLQQQFAEAQANVLASVIEGRRKSSDLHFIPPDLARKSVVVWTAEATAAFEQ